MGSTQDGYGLETERRRREITAFHGVPDFVFRPVDVSKGSAQRQIGDFLLWVGDVVAIVSHKSRQPEAAARESPDRRRRWLDSTIEKASSQVAGVARTLQMAGEDEILLQSERGVRVPWSPAKVTTYLGVVVVDGPQPDRDYAPPVMDEPVPTVAMFSRDWDALHQLLPSTMAIIRYLVRRFRTVPRCPMGSELDVFALLVEHDVTGDDFALPDDGLPRGYFEQIFSRHPEWFLGGQSEDRFAYLVNAMIEGAADADPEYSEAADALVYMEIVEFLDRIPLLHRVPLGKEAIDRCHRAGRSGSRVVMLSGLPHGLLVFCVDQSDRKERAQELRSLTAARHSQVMDAGAPGDHVTLGVATEPLPAERGRSHDFVLIRGGIRSDADFRARRDELFGVPELTSMVELWRTTRR